MIPRESDEMSTGGRIEEPYSKLIMRGAFVVQLRKASQDPAGLLEGSVEEVDTGKPYQFHSEEELLHFLRRRFTEGGGKEGSE